ncbi:hypothetical protein SNE40_016181 [Patella caerulea]|uniref:Transmembrane protein n=1 Tax=Patella caerulea TaxID=87958 RepID=A0AAN8JDN6_PATCE
MNTLLVIAVVAVIGCVGLTEATCNNSTAMPCKGTFEGVTKSNKDEKCNALNTYMHCLIGADCFTGSAAYRAEFNTAVTTESVTCDCSLTIATKCVTASCDDIGDYKACLDVTNCYNGIYKTTYDAKNLLCGGAGAATVSLTLMAISSLFMILKNNF